MRFQFTLLALLCLGGPVARAQDEVIFLDRAAKKENKVTGAIQSESPNGITLKAGGGAIRDAAAIDVIDVVYDVSATFRVDYRNASARDLAGERATSDDSRKREFADAKSRYEKLRDTTRDERAKRQVEFRLARLAALQASDDASISSAIAQLSGFQKTHPQAWQTGRVVDLLATLHVARSDYDSALRIYQEFAGTPNLSRDGRQDCELKMARVLLDARKHDAADVKLKQLAQETAAGSPLNIRAQILLAECQAGAGKGDDAVKQLETLIERTTDPDLKAVAHNALGDCHRLANRPRDAMWSYLWVDVIYHGDRREHARALYHLVTLFQQFKDNRRATEFREKLTSPAFAGIDYQRKMIAGK